MDTPDKNQTSTPTSSLQTSKFENSPVFNYISSLSPIEPAKSIHMYHTFNSPTFASPLSFFASPQAGSHRESRFSLRRHLCSDQSKSELLLCKHENNSKEAVSENVQPSDPCTELRECPIPGSLKIVGIPEQSGKELELELEIEMPQTLKYESGSPDSNFMLHDLTGTGPRMLDTLSAPLGTDKDDSERQPLFERELHLRKICRIQENEDVAGFDWMTSVSEVTDLLMSNSSITEENIVEKDKKSVNPGTVSLMSTFLKLPQNDATDLENFESVNPSNSCNQSEMEGTLTQSGETGHMNATDQTPTFLSGNLLDKLVVSDPAAEVENEQQPRIRRRCLVFEMAGAHKKKLLCNSNSTSSTLLPSDSKTEYFEKHLVPSKTDGYQPSVSSGIGLHLNELVTISKDGSLHKHENLSSRIQFMSMPGSSASSSSAHSMMKNMVLSDDENEVMEAVAQPSTGIVGDESDQNSPQKKRLKFEYAGGSQACKRCNCRRSKCLKLYCECFAAGLYCIEPCSCQDCFNKPAHTDIVLETRRLIESRNPIAFAPKVIRSTESVPEPGDETNKTPASARHKRGCNCKKSSCLKKYCECFQGGVGCCFSCRCEGCKNTFGRKDEADEIEFEGEDAESERNKSEASSCENLIKNGEEDPNLPIIPSEIVRSPVQTQHSFNGKLLGSFYVKPTPPSCTSQKLKKSETFNCEPHYKVHLQAIPEDGTPEVLKSDRSPASGTQTASPTSKRVSPPHPDVRSSAAWHSNRKLGLRSIRPFPSLNRS